MPTTFGRRAAPTDPSPPPRALEAATDPRLEALARSMGEADPSRAELADYFARRRAAIGPWMWVANVSAVAAPVATYMLHAPLGLVLGVGVASTASRMLLRRGRLRWAAEIETGAREGSRFGDAANEPYSSTSKL